MHKTATIAASTLAAISLLVPAFASAQTTLSATCSGTASATAITWTGTTAGGVAPVALLWGNGATTSPITVAAAPGGHTMTLQATDASSTVATTSCTATVASTTPSGTGSLAARIQALLAQINALRQQLLSLAGNGSGTASSTPPGLLKGCPVPARNLGIGARGDDVKELQLFLASSTPDHFSAANATGFFGPLTAKAMKHFQETNGIASSTDGSVGPLTRGFLGKHCGLIEGMGHLKGTAKSPLDLLVNGSTTKVHGNSGHNASSTDD